MKRTRMMLTVSIMVSIFIICFLIGRATALRDIEKQNSVKEFRKEAADIPEDTEDTAETSANMSGISENRVPKEMTVQSSEVNVRSNEDKQIPAPPDRMQFPCGKQILNQYSQTAVYSKSTGDWRSHTGIDYAASLGADVLSAYDGNVIAVYEDKLWGHCVEIIHTGNIVGIYKNLQNNIYVNKNDAVNSGQVIGKVGESAAIEKNEEPHLHFELWMNGEPINPESFVY